MMEHYHQPYSEIKNMRWKDIEFFVSLAEAEMRKEADEIDKIKAEVKNMRGKIR